jgi:hypothetical protein
MRDQNAGAPLGDGAGQFSAALDSTQIAPEM